MPHFIIDCSPGVFEESDQASVMQLVFDAAQDSALFAIADIKVRTRVFKEFTVGGSCDDFLHVFAYIMEGRTIEQRRSLSELIVGKLKEVLPAVPTISMNVMEFEKATYHNRESV